MSAPRLSLADRLELRARELRALARKGPHPFHPEKLAAMADEYEEARAAVTARVPEARAS